MSAQSLQTACQIILALGLFLAAAGGFGSYWFGKQMQHQRDIEGEFKHSELIRGQQSIRRLLEDKVKDLDKQLIDRYSLGYGLIYSDGRSLIYEDQTVGVKVDWSKAKIEEMAQDKMVVRLPDWTDLKQQVTAISSYAIVDRKPGHIVRAFATKNILVRIEILENSSDYVIFVIGFAKK